MLLALVTVMYLLLAVDWLQTVTIAREPAKWVERNLLLGPHPGEAAVHTYFCAVAALLALAIWLLDWPYLLAASVLLVEAVCVYRNWWLGVSLPTLRSRP